MQYTCHEQRDSGVLALLVVVCLLSSLQVVTLFAGCHTLCRLSHSLQRLCRGRLHPRPSLLVSMETMSSMYTTKCEN